MKDYMFKFGSYEFPSKWIAEGGYDSKPNQRQDLDPYQDQFGVTVRNGLKHTKSYVEIKTTEIPWNEFAKIMQGLVSNYQSYEERDAICEYWDFESMDYKTGHLYFDPSFKTGAQEFGKTVKETTFIFTEY